MPPSDSITQQSIAAFEDALSSLPGQTSSDLPDGNALTHENGVVRDWYADMERTISLQRCLNGQWEAAWEIVARQAQKKGITRAAWESQVWKDLLDDPLLQARPM